MLLLLNCFASLLSLNVFPHYCPLLPRYIDVSLILPRHVKPLSGYDFGNLLILPIITSLVAGAVLLFELHFYTSSFSFSCPVCANCGHRKLHSVFYCICKLSISHPKRSSCHRTSWLTLVCCAAQQWSQSYKEMTVFKIRTVVVALISFLLLK